MTLGDFLPPVLTRGLRKVRHRIHGSKAHFDVDGHRIRHRGTSADRAVVNQIFLDRDYDFARLRRHGEIVRFYEACEQPLIVDAGANIGASAVWFAKEFPKATVVAVEPEAHNFALLEQNVAGLQVRPVLGALAGEPGEVQLFDPGEGEWAFRTGHAASSELIGSVRAYTIDELAPPGCTPFVLKIDIEGAESGVFERCAEIANRFPVVVIELHDWMLPRSGSSQSFLRWHASQDRDFVHIRENVFSLCNRRLPTTG